MNNHTPPKHKTPNYKLVPTVFPQGRVEWQWVPEPLEVHRKDLTRQEISYVYGYNTVVNEEVAALNRMHTQPYHPGNVPMNRYPDKKSRYASMYNLINRDDVAPLKKFKSPNGLVRFGFRPF